ncbi:MAG TPA: hypothetical protein VNY10_09920 [Roseiarcus sp.]|jgi:hypothetical protein|nr:hypothetical protein [Roseiarcus sp.]
MKESMTWSAGYPTEIEYTYGYYRELYPTYLRLACLSAGIATAKADPLKYLELGFGQGVSINIHAAGNEGDFGEPTSIQARLRTRGSLPKRQAQARRCSTRRLPNLPRAPTCRTSTSSGCTAFGPGFRRRTAESSSTSFAASLRSAASSM